MACGDPALHRHAAPGLAKTPWVKAGVSTQSRRAIEQVALAVTGEQQRRHYEEAKPTRQSIALILDRHAAPRLAMTPQ
jgi:hypothetical protein